MEGIRILELFGGIGAIRKAFERQNIPHKVIDYVEIDKYAVASYNAMFNENFNVANIKEWDKQIDVDFIMHGSPCQDFSVAGKQAGGNLGSGTRSSLMYETVRIVGKLRPKYVMWENVKNLLSKKHKHNFDAYIETMNILGYNSYYQVLNAKDYGIPQKRERVYTVSIRKDIDKGTFKFPEKEELKLILKDMLEDKVDEKYYLSNKMLNYILDINETQKGTAWESRVDEEILNQDIAHTIGVRSAGGNQRFGVSNFVVEGCNKKIKVKEFKSAYIRDFGSRGKLQDVNGCCDTLVAAMGTGGGNVPIIKNNIRIRKLTPKECWRLMGFNDEDFDKAEKVNSNTQLYKQAGNSIVVNVLEKILQQLF